MKKIILLLSLNFLFAGIGFSQGYFGQIDSVYLPTTGPSHYQPEYHIDVPVNAAAWAKEKAGLNVGFGSEEQLYFRTEVPQLKSGSASWDATGWKGERLNTQIVVWSPDSIQQVRFKLNDLKSENGSVL